MMTRRLLRPALDIQYKTLEQVRLMRAAGLVVADVLAQVGAAVAPGVTTAELDELSREVIRSHGAVSSFLGYHGYPATLCTSVNDQVVHAIPSPEQVLREGDRLELLRPLRVDPKVARRERFVGQGARSTGLFAKRRPNSKAGY